MTRDPRYDVLFEPVKIGPVTAPNRFFQVPHADGMGYAMPRGVARMREVKAEGGWGVVCTGYCSIHPSSDDTPHVTAHALGRRGRQGTGLDGGGRSPPRRAGGRGALVRRHRHEQLL